MELGPRLLPRLYVSYEGPRGLYCCNFVNFVESGEVSAWYLRYMMPWHEVRQQFRSN